MKSAIRCEQRDDGSIEIFVNDVVLGRYAGLKELAMHLGFCIAARDEDSGSPQFTTPKHKHKESHMDPDACLSALFEAFAEGDKETAADRAEDLMRWLDKGGFKPGADKLRFSSLTDFLIEVSRQGYPFGRVNR